MRLMMSVSAFVIRLAPTLKRLVVWLVQRAEIRSGGACTVMEHVTGAQQITIVSSFLRPRDGESLVNMVTKAPDISSMCPGCDPKR